MLGDGAENGKQHSESECPVIGNTDPLVSRLFSLQDDVATGLMYLRVAL